MSASMDKPAIPRSDPDASGRSGGQAGLGTITAAMLALVPAAAHAHAFLLHASPSVGSTVRVAPAEVRIDFSAGVEPAFSGITVTDDAGTEVGNGPPRPEGDSSLAVALKPLRPGRYHVQWHAVATDTHRTQGSFAFTVTP